MSGTARKRRQERQSPPVSSDDDNDDYDDNDSDNDDEEDDMEENSDNDSGISGGEESEEEEEEDDDDDDAIAEEADANAQQQMLPSPPGSGPGSGMRLRSGRKKRRRRSADGNSAASAAAAAAAGTPRRRAAAAAAAAAMSAARSRPTTRTTPSRKNAATAAAAAAAAASSAKKRKRGTTAAARKARKTVRIVGVGGGGDDDYESDSSSEGSSGSEVGEQRQKPRANGGKSKSGRKPAAKRRRRGDADEDEGDDEEEMEEIAAATETQRLRTEQNDLRSREATREQQVQDRLESNRTLLATVRGQRLVHHEREGAEDDPAPPPAFLSPPADRAALAEAAGADSELDEDGGGTDGDTSPLHSVSLKLPPRTARKAQAQAQASSRAGRRPSRNGRSGGAAGAHLSGRKDPVAAEAAATSGRTDPVAAEAEADDEEAESVEGAATVARPGLLRRASSGVAAHLWKFTDTIRPTVRPGVGRVMVPEAERPTPEQARVAEGSGGTAQLGAPATSAAASVAQRRRGLRQHPVFWLLAWLVLHTVVAMLSGGVVVRPLWSSLPETSQRRLHFYRSLMGQFIPNGGGTTSGKVIIPDDAALEGEDDDDNDEEESPPEPEVIEKVVEEIVYEDEPDDDLYQSELQLRKDAAIASQRQKDQEAADAASAAALAAHEARKKQRDETMRKKKEQAAAEADVEVLRNLRTAVEIRNKEAKSVANRVDTQVKSYEELVAEGDDAVAARYKKLQAWEEALEKAEQAIQKLEDGMAGAASNGSAVNLAETLNVLKTASVLPVMPSLLDPRTVTIPGEACNGMEYVPIGDAVAELDDSAISTSSTIARRQAEEDTEDAPIQMEDLEQAKKDLVQLADSTADTIISDDGIVNAVRHWLNKEIKNAGLDLTAKLDDDKEEDVLTLNNEQPAQADGEEDTDGLSAQAVKQIISHRLGLDIADGDGMFDFASIRSGASVVLTGPRRTSPSLKDNLPLLNRLLASAKLRFYGHPPEAALNPTYPPNALGQCWAFEAGKGPTLDDDTDNAVGRYATLTINLSEPVQIKSVTMEHAPRDLTPTPGTAIRDFRVIGYEGSDAKGAPIPLGSFRYEIDGPRTLQEFEVESEEGGDLSSLTSVTLAIDSNWGADYSCLYRFRVHGDRPVPLPTSSVHSSCEE